MRRLRSSVVVAVVTVALSACDGDGPSPTEPGAPSPGCGPYPDWETSAYVLPYPVGAAYVVSQGNCTTGSHQGPARHAYDFAMPIGSLVVAARGGTVVGIDDTHPDGTNRPEDDNVVTIQQDDGSLARYVHIQQGGALVDVDDLVFEGEPIARSGNSGSTSGLPHLHFQVTPCPDRDVCGTLPVTFRNTEPNAGGLVGGRLYEALPESDPE